ncbi:alpha/beta hydrolase [Vogesella sp. EB]|uniref:RBBP9/YdeN family alpha/beta hydrolase n=1 Tax=Vogesella sp. EB TaxID=1526735 RepID=UPI00064D5350|nr:alpha/beta hydrolase [Vogesella sp. EB]KMJ54002.1 alpha/beta hydrolase [Vogesella sp. EB]
MAHDFSGFDYIIQPGWNNSGPEHWQSHWQQTLAATRVANHDWQTPQLDDWLVALDAAVAAATQPVIVIAHSLGCATVAHYAARYGNKLAGALLVAPADVERASAPAALQPFAPLPELALPFPARVVASDSDPFSLPLRSARMAALWQSPLHWLRDAGHINVASGHRQWQDGLAQLAVLVADIRQQPQPRAAAYA